MNNYCCYILRNKKTKYKNLTYNGSTNNLTNRIRQHNGEISGGAKYTSGKGEWEYYAIITGFQTQSNALCCEWKIRYPGKGRRRVAGYSGVEGRIKSLNHVLKLDKWTVKCNSNQGVIFNLYVAEDMAHLIKLDALPDNIGVYSVKDFNTEFLRQINYS